MKNASSNISYGMNLINLGILGSLLIKGWVNLLKYESRYVLTKAYKLVQNSAILIS